MEDCIFCKIIKGDLPSYTVYEDSICKGILDISPASRGHVIVILKKHFDNIYMIDESNASGIGIALNKIAKAMKEALKCSGLNILQNNEEISGQTVFHLHFHLIPRYVDDGIEFDVGHKEFSKEEFELIKCEIKEKM